MSDQGREIHTSQETLPAVNRKLIEIAHARPAVDTLSVFYSALYPAHSRNPIGLKEMEMRLAGRFTYDGPSEDLKKARPAHEVAFTWGKIVSRESNLVRLQELEEKAITASELKEAGSGIRLKEAQDETTRARRELNTLRGEALVRTANTDLSGVPEENFNKAIEELDKEEDATS